MTIRIGLLTVASALVLAAPAFAQSTKDDDETPLTRGSGPTVHIESDLIVSEVYGDFDGDGEDELRYQYHSSFSEWDEIPPLIGQASSTGSDSLSWRDPVTWGTSYLIGYGAEAILRSVATTAGGAVTGGWSLLWQIPGDVDALANGGPTEREFPIPVTLIFGGDLLLEQAETVIQPGLPFRFDVTVSGGTEVVLDQASVVLENLHINGELSGRSDLLVKSDLSVNGTYTNAGGTVHGNLSTASSASLAVGSPISVRTDLISSGDLNPFYGSVVGNALNGGTITIPSGRALSIAGDLMGSGDASVFGTLTVGDAFTMGGDTQVSGSLNLGGGASSAIVSGTITLDGGRLTSSPNEFIGDGLVTGSGQVYGIAGGHVLATGEGNIIELFANSTSTSLAQAETGGTLLWRSSYSPTNEGVLEGLDGGLLSVVGPSPGTGTFENLSQMRVRSGGVMRLLNSLNLTGDGAVQIDAGGTMKTGNNGLWTIVTPVVNEGTINVSQGTLQMASLLLQGGGLFATSAFTIADGHVHSGHGSITAPTLYLDGRLSPDALPSPAIAVTGSCNQRSTGILDLTIGPDASSAISITGTASLGGTLRVALINGCTPQIGDHFRILSAASVTGQFATLDLPLLESPATWDVHYASDHVTLRVTRLKSEEAPPMDPRP